MRAQGKGGKKLAAVAAWKETPHAEKRKAREKQDNYRMIST